MIVIRDLKHKELNISDWRINDADHVCVFTKNGNDAKALTALFTGSLKYDSAHQQHIPADIATVSFAALQEVYLNEIKIDETDLTNEIDLGTPVKAFLPERCHSNELIDHFNLRHRMDTGYRQLSTGESLKLLILKAVFGGKKWLFCENPFDSLDIASRQHLHALFPLLKKRHITVVLMLNNPDDRPDDFDQYALLESGQLNLLENTNITDIQHQVNQFYQESHHAIALPPDYDKTQRFEYPLLVNLKDCTVTYEGVNVLEDINLKIAPLQHTIVSGRNGSGKSTLLNLITGDCPQCYSNDVTVFGYKRGSGESIWDIKKHYGLVSSELHRSYRIRCNVLTVVLSGYFDSIGLYKEVSDFQIKTASHWLTQIGLSEQANNLFSTLSHGEQRLVLIARALVKRPLLLILDEPTQGLDQSNRKMILAFLERLAHLKLTTILYVSHRQDEFLPLFVSKLSL